MDSFGVTLFGPNFVAIILCISMFFILFFWGLYIKSCIVHCWKCELQNCEMLLKKIQPSDTVKCHAFQQINIETTSSASGHHNASVDLLAEVVRCLPSAKGLT